MSIIRSFMDYFDDHVEYPRNIAADPLPVGTLYQYVSNTFLNGFINYVKPISAFVMNRYHDWDEVIRHEISLSDPPGEYRWRKFTGLTKNDVYQKILHKGAMVHGPLGIFQDDVIVLAGVEDEPNMYYFFWFDCDTSDCMIGRFECGETKEEIIHQFEKYVHQLQIDLRDLPDATCKELPMHFLTGWMKFK